jgi:hypothetical protein
MIKKEAKMIMIFGDGQHFDRAAFRVETGEGCVSGRDQRRQKFVIDLA